MKERMSWVSNSSTSSFIINKRDLSTIQEYAIKKHVEICEEFGLDKSDDDYTNSEWCVNVDDRNNLGMLAIMDNFNMSKYLEEIVGIDKNLVHWNDF